jgi:transcriptional regulator with XRE-family HTH domain
MVKRKRQLLAKNVRRLRRARGWTQYDLAEAANVRQALISQIENGAANPTLETLERLAAAFGAKLADLFATE